jgi:DNA mismatch endonuclease, patch repair protein
MKRKTYIRDKRSPKPKNELVSKTMSAIKAKNTTPEMFLRKELWKNGVRGFRLHWKNVPGKPDIAFIKYKLAVFVNGCYWHRCPKCELPLPKHNSKFWAEKFDRNADRDKRKIKLLKDQGWKVIVIWECDIKKNVIHSANTIISVLNKMNHHLN